MKLKRNKLVSLFLVFSLLALSGNLYAKKRGAELLITKKDRQQIKGELITVKPNSLLLLDAEGKDVSIDIAEIKVIRIVKKSKILKGAGIGLIIGGGGGALLGQAANCTETPQAWILVALIGGGVGVLTGVILGAIAGIDKTIQIEGKSDLEIREALDKLRKKARIRDYK